jgi:hypothetical protein
MYDQAKLLNYIQIYEERYLIDLLGARLYDEFILDLDNNNYPESPNFQKIFDPFHYDNASTGFFTRDNLYNKVVISSGILEMLKGFIYFEYVKDSANQMTSNGQVIPQNENSLTATTLYNMMYTRYWEALKTYRAIQWYIITNQNAPIGSLLTTSIFMNGSGYDGDVWYSNLEQSNAYNTTTSCTGGVVQFTSWGINGLKGFTPSSIGTGYTNDTLCNLFGLGGASVQVFTNPLGNPNNIQIVEAGTGYSIGEVLTIQGGNNDQTITVTQLGDGEVKDLSVFEGGSGYVVGDKFTLISDTHPNTDVLAIVVVSKVTVGDFKKFNGTRKQMAYWL